MEETGEDNLFLPPASAGERRRGSMRDLSFNVPGTGCRRSLSTAATIIRLDVGRVSAYKTALLGERGNWMDLGRPGLFEGGTVGLWDYWFRVVRSVYLRRESSLGVLVLDLDAFGSRYLIATRGIFRRQSSKPPEFLPSPKIHLQTIEHGHSSTQDY